MGEKEVRDYRTWLGLFGNHTDPLEMKMKMNKSKKNIALEKVP